MISGGSRCPPFHRTLNIALVEVQQGRAVFVGVPLSHHSDAAGLAHSGWISTILISVLDCAVQTLLPADTSSAMVEFTLNMTRAPSRSVGPLRAVGVVRDRGRGRPIADGHLESESGEIFAYATSTNVHLHNTPI